MRSSLFRLSFLLFSLLICIPLFSQEFKKDTRNQKQKEDSKNSYQVEIINDTDILQALEIAGIRIFKFPLSPFDKEYKMEIIIDEYVNGEKSNLSNINISTTYSFPDDENDPDKYYVDYIDQLLFFMKDKEDISEVTIKTYAGTRWTRFDKKITRKRQFYMWRKYSKAGWKLNETVPLLVYASSWNDDAGYERFCGAVDLSDNEEDTAELLNSSKHYYIISYKVFE